MNGLVQFVGTKMTLQMHLNFMTIYMIESGWSYIYDKIDNFDGFKMDKETK